MDIVQIIKDRLIPINAVITSAGFIAAGVDLLMPRFPQAVNIGFCLLGLFALMIVVRKFGWATGKMFQQPLFWYIGIFVLVTGTGAVASTIKKDSGGVLASASESVRELQAHLGIIENKLTAIQEDVHSIAVATVPGASTDPVLELGKLHYGMDDESMARAIRSADLRAIALFQQAGNHLPYLSDGQSNIERLIIDKNPRLPAVLDAFKAQGQDLNIASPLEFFIEHSAELPRMNDVVALARQKAAGSFFVPIAHLRANALTLAVWFDNQEVGRKLLALGANPEKGVEVAVTKVTSSIFPASGKSAPRSAQEMIAAVQNYKASTTITENVIPVTTARAEAKKLGRQWFTETLASSK